MMNTPALAQRRALVTDHAWPSIDIERDLLASAGVDLVDGSDASDDELVELATDVDAILVNWRVIPPPVLDHATRCVVISRYGVGTDNIPVSRATELGIVVTNVPTFCTNEVADHAMALLLACARRIPALTAATRAGHWDLTPTIGAPRLTEQTLGLVGYGNIARAMAHRAHGFGLHIVVYTPRLAHTPGRLTTNPDVTALPLEELLTTSHYVSLHAPATTATTGLIGAAQLAQMRPDAYLINTSRGALIDEDALHDALAAGQLAGAALDVLHDEPPSEGHRLVRHPHVLATPHTGFYSESAIRALQTSAATNVTHALGGTSPPTIVNHEVLHDTARLRMHTSEAQTSPVEVQATNPGTEGTGERS